MTTDVVPTQIEEWLTDRVVAYGKATPDSFTVDTPLSELGLDSVYALTLCGDIEDEYDLEVDPTIVWDYPTIRELAGGIAELAAK